MLPLQPDLCFSSQKGASSSQKGAFSSQEGASSHSSKAKVLENTSQWWYYHPWALIVLWRCKYARFLTLYFVWCHHYCQCHLVVILLPPNLVHLIMSLLHSSAWGEKHYSLWKVGSEGPVVQREEIFHQDIASNKISFECSFCKMIGRGYAYMWQKGLTSL